MDDIAKNDVGREDSTDAPPKHNGVGREDSTDVPPEHNGVGREDSTDAPPEHNGVGREDSTDASPKHNSVGREGSIDAPPEHNSVGREGSIDAPLKHNGVGREDSIDATLERAIKKRRTRGATNMHEITRDSSEGQRRVIEYNEDGQPIGVNATKLKSFIGTCVRHHVPIIYDNWKIVPSEIKEKIYNLIKGGFVVDPRSKKNILQNAGTSFRQFKHVLTAKYIMPFKDDLVSLKSPPILYSHIEQEHWNTFVNSRLNEEFEKLSQKNQEMRGKNIYNHRLSRKGYANLAEELKKSSSYDENINGRCILWKSARMNNEGMIVDEQTQKVVTRIDDMLATQSHNSDVTSTTEDVLSLALGTPDHSGRVRGVGKFITPTQYFHIPKPSSRPKVQAHHVEVFQPEVLNACTALLGLEKGLVSSKKSRVRSTSED